MCLIDFFFYCIPYHFLYQVMVIEDAMIDVMLEIGDVYALRDQGSYSLVR